MRLWKRIILGAVIIAGCASLMPQLLALPAFAAAPSTSSPAQDEPAESRTLNLITSPLPINLQATPGSVVTTDLRIKNGSPYPERLRVSLMKFTAFGEEGKPGIQERGPEDDYFDWVSFSKPAFTAPPDQWVTLQMTIKVPKNAAFGYYFAAVFSRDGQPAKAGNGKNVVLGSSAALVLLDVSAPGAVREAAITAFSADKRVYEFLPASFSVKIKNSGNIHLIPGGNIYIKRGDSVVATLPVNSGNGNVLPGSNRIFTTAWRDGFPVYADKEAGGRVMQDANGKPVRELRWDSSRISKLRIGRYSANVLMAYDNGKTDVPIEAALSFWVIPWRLLAAAAAVILVPAIVVYALTSWRFKRRLAKQEEPQQRQPKKAGRPRTKPMQKDD